jgi:hypothetical protein
MSQYIHIMEEMILGLVVSKFCPCPSLINRHAMKAYGGVEVQLHHSWRRHWMEVTGQLDARPLYPRGKSTRYPLYRSLGGPKSRSERYRDEMLATYAGSGAETSEVLFFLHKKVLWIFIYLFHEFCVKKAWILVWTN